MFGKRLMMLTRAIHIGMCDCTCYAHRVMLRHSCSSLLFPITIIKFLKIYISIHQKEVGGDDNNNNLCIRGGGENSRPSNYDHFPSSLVLHQDHRKRSVHNVGPRWPKCKQHRIRVDSSNRSLGLTNGAVAVQN